jgi:tetratricopeptide (TPR) repeat protein
MFSPSNRTIQRSSSPRLIEFDAGNIEESVPLVRKSIELAPNEFSMAFELRHHSFQTGDYDKHSACQKALSITPESIEARYLLGNLYCETGKWNEALVVFYKILLDDPADDTAKARYNEILKAMGKKEAATKIPSPAREKKNPSPSPRAKGLGSAETSSQPSNASYPAESSPASHFTVMPNGKLDPISECAFMADSCTG